MVSTTEELKAGFRKLEDLGFSLEQISLRGCRANGVYHTMHGCPKISGKLDMRSRYYNPLTDPFCSACLHMDVNTRLQGPLYRLFGHVNKWAARVRAIEKLYPRDGIEPSKYEEFLRVGVTDDLVDNSKRWNEVSAYFPGGKKRADAVISEGYARWAAFLTGDDFAELRKFAAEKLVPLPELSGFPAELQEEVTASVLELRARLAADSSRVLVRAKRLRNIEASYSALNAVPQCLKKFTVLPLVVFNSFKSQVNAEYAVLNGAFGDAELEVFKALYEPDGVVGPYTTMQAALDAAVSV